VKTSSEVFNSANCAAVI